MEQWKDVPGWEGFYQVSNLGRVRSLSRMVYAGSGRYRLSKETMLRPAYNIISGYPYVNFRREATGTMYSVHGLVALCFIGPRPEGLEVRHLDGNPRNASLANLAYGTHKENMTDCVAHGTRATGSAKPQAITADQVALIKSRLGSISIRKLAKEIGINRATIMKVANGAHWSAYEGSA